MADLYFFYLCPLHCGTTITAQYIAASVDGYLSPYGNYEGLNEPSVAQFVPKRSYRKQVPFNWPAIKDAWDTVLAESGKTIFVEASPQNIMHLDEMLPVFEPGYRAVLGISHPLRMIGSLVKLNTGDKRRTISLSKDLGRRLSFSIKKTLKYMQQQAENRQRYAFPVVTYEGFCANPKVVAEAFGVEGADPTIKLPGKRRSEERQIRDLSGRDTAYLKEDEITAVLEAFQPHEDLLASFGYTLPENVDAVKARYDPAEWQIGVERRQQFDRDQAAHLSLEA